MRIAAFGDIHGNIFALQAVLADLRSQKPDGLLVTGDLVYKFPWGAEVVDLLRSLPCQIILGNAELYLALWDTSLWPEKWNLPRARELVMWERERLGRERLAWLANLPEHVAFAGRRLEDLVAVHGVPGNPFVPFLARPGDDRSPWVQSDARVRELLAGLDAEMVVCGHTHTTLLRKVDRTLIVNPGAVGYGRGADTGVGRADYALLDWSAAAGWYASFRSVSYDPEPLHRALLALRGDYPVAAYVANRQRPASATLVPDEPLDFVRYRWGDAPDWWEDRDELPVWRALRGDGSGP
jgi:3',5'-cyclic AMP phosphodiesterase CpdA